ncbi:MAG: cytidylyltransferase domain-containing protein [Alphaproteobacteria bacterium]
MSSIHKILAVIPARGGSKGLPRKNVLPLDGKPLIAWTIEAAKSAQRIDRVVLSTDDDEIAEVGRTYGCDVPFRRPAELAGDRSRQADVVAHAAKFLAAAGEGPYDIVVCLQPTTPLRKPSHIDEAVDAFLESGAESLISLKEQDYPPWWMFALENGRIRPAFGYEPGVNVFDMVRQQFPTVYRPNGAIYITRTESLFLSRRLVDIENCAYYLMPDEDSVSIDTALHFATAEAMARQARRG